MKEFCDISIGPQDGPQMVMESEMDREAFAEKHCTVPTGRVSVSSNLFPIMLKAMQQIVQGTRWDKKARIVLEYDPQNKKMEIVSFMESAESVLLEGRESK